jgi:methyltransferase
MTDFTVFLALFSLIILQRLMELRIAKRNETWMKAQGAIEFGSRHYRYLVLMHLCFFISLLTEKIALNKGMSPLWPVIFGIFLLAQTVRVWALLSLGRFWNTKIIVLPNAEVVLNGPYRYIKHPNYLVVAVELAVIPLLFGAYLTAIIFSIVNAIMMFIRIPEEEYALQNLTEYSYCFQGRNRFLPKLLK